MVSLDLWNSDRKISRSVLSDFWGMFNDLDRSILVPVVHSVTTDRTVVPACDVTETEDSFFLTIDVPGLKKNDINIEVTGRQLAISGERKQEEPIKGGSTYRNERSFGRFHRIFEVPEGTNTEVIEASYESGVLRLAIPKSESVRVRKIEIADGGKGLLRRLAGKQEAKMVNG